MRIAAILAALLLATPAAPETLGWGRLFTNDYFGDNHDRWRTGAYVISNVRGPSWNGARPEAIGEIVELRFRSEIIAPRSLTNPNDIDRRYAGTVSLGLHTHFSRGEAEISAGVDLIAVGPQTKLANFQTNFHELVGAPTPTVTDDQIDNAVRLGFTGEIARPVRVNDITMVRPFAEIMTSPETLARVGVDVVFGLPGQSDLMIRDVTTGHLYRGTDTIDGGQSFVLGADISQVMSSMYLPDDGAATLTDIRFRARAGWHWQIAEDTSFFYGITYLSEEFDEQPEGQILGSLKLNFNF